jgi:hypothetical protein
LEGTIIVKVRFVASYPGTIVAHLHLHGLSKVQLQNMQTWNPEATSDGISNAAKTVTVPLVGFHGTLCACLSEVLDSESKYHPPHRQPCASNIFVPWIGIVQKT